MASQTALDRWQLVLDALGQVVPPKSVSTWFLNTELLHFDEERVELGAANVFIKGWIEENYRDLLLDIIEQQSGVRPELSIRISPEKFRAMREKQAEEVETAGPEAVVEEMFPAPAPAPVRLSGSALNETYRFEHFTLGENNRFAHAAARAAVEQPGAYSPILIHAGHGLGKSHLLHAIGNLAQEKNACRKIVFMTGNDFVRQFTQSFVEKSLESFRKIFAGCDLLLIDDIQVLAEGKKAATQEEFLHLFDTLGHAGCQIVLTSDRAPECMLGLNKRLLNRLGSGLAVRILAPDRDARRLMLQRMLHKRGVEPTPDALDEAAAFEAESIRELEGLTGRLAAMQLLAGSTLTPGAVRQAIRGDSHEDAEPLTIDAIARSTAAQFGVSVADLCGRKRQKRIALARKLAIHLARHFTHQTLTEIGQYFGGRDYSTVISTLKIAPVTLLPLERLEAHVRSICNALGRADATADLLSRQGTLFPHDES